ncbi:MAG: GAF domain-containing protein, partial [Terracidiphilus sp.]
WHTGERAWAALERARAEAALRASEEKYRTLFDSIDNPIAVLEVLYDEQGRPDNLRFMQTNKVFEKATGFKDHIGKTSQELIPNLEDSCIEKYARVAETGEPVRFESFSRDFGCWMDIFASRLGGAGSRLVNVLFEDITERKRAEVELRDREESKAYQLRLSDALRLLLDPIEIQGTASTLLGEELHADRAMYVEVDEVKQEILVAREFVRTDAPSLVGRHDLEEIMWVSSGFRRGRPTVVNDVSTAPFVPQELVEKMLANEVVSFITVPLLKGDHLVGTLCATSATPRIWTPSEVSRVQDTADRTWAAVEHARADAARRSSDEKYGTLFNAIDQAIAVVEIVYNDAGEAIDLRYLETNSVWERQNGITNAAGRMLTEILPQIGLPCIRRYARIAETGESGRFEAHVEELGIWLDISATRVGGPGSRVVSIVFYDITERKNAENELRRSEERKAFLLKLSDALRPHADAIEVQGTVTEMLCEHLGADRVFYAEIDETLSEAVVERDFARAGKGSLAGRHPLEVFGWMASSPKKGEAGMIEDVRVTTLIPEADRAKVAALQLIAFISVPLVKDNRVVGALCVTQMKPRV